MFGSKPRHHAAEIALCNGGVLVDGTCQKRHGKRAPAYEADPKLLAYRQDLRFRIARHYRVLVLHSRDLLHGMSTTQGLGSWFRQSEMQYLALGDQVLDCACNVFDGNLRINAVLVDEVDPIGAPPLQHGVDGPANVLGAAIQATHPATSIGINVPAEF